MLKMPSIIVLSQYLHSMMKNVDEETRNKLKAVDALIRTTMRDRKIVQEEHNFLKELR